MSRPRLRYAALLAALAGVLLLALGVRALTRGDGKEHSSPTLNPPASTSSSATSVAPVEVPNVVGVTLQEARIVLSAAGLRVVAPSAPASVTVVNEDPPAGSVIAPGSQVSLDVTALAGARGKAAKGRRFTVCIDPGHQRKSNNSPEPIGPKARVSKPKVTGGTTGVSTGLPEYEVALQIAVNLKRRFEADGVRVVMTRTTNDVDLSNAERAAIANRNKADLFLRVHCDGSPDSGTSGVSTLYPADNRWTSGFSAESRNAAKAVQRSVVAETGAADRGTVARQDLAGFNYARVPSILVECGFMSNSVEDRLLASPQYQDKLARGIEQGVLDWLDAGRD